jgi:hypothetical protein
MASQHCVPKYKDGLPVASLEVTFWYRGEGVRVFETLLILLCELNIAQSVQTHLIKISEKRSANALVVAIDDSDITHLWRAYTRGTSVAAAVAAS